MSLVQPRAWLAALLLLRQVLVGGVEEGLEALLLYRCNCSFNGNGDSAEGASVLDFR